MKSLKLIGSAPKKWGQQHGEAFKDDIHALNEIRQRLLRKYLSNWDAGKIKTLCQAHLKTLETQYPELFQEVRGLHEASGLSMEDLMVLNAYTDIRDFSYGENTRVEDGCSIIAVKTKHANWVAQTWDMHASATPYTVFLDYPEVEERNCPSQKVLSVAGCLGLAGINQSGVSVMINNVHCKEFNESGLIWTGLVRQLLQQKNAREACEYIKDNLPSSGHNYMISDNQNAFNVEATGKRFEITSQLSLKEDGYYVHTNHYLGSLASTEIMERQSPTTQNRLRALENYFSDNKWDQATSSDLRKEFFESGSASKIICIAPPMDPDGGATCGGLIVDQLNHTAVGFQGLWADNKRVTIKY